MQNIKEVFILSEVSLGHTLRPPRGRGSCWKFFPLALPVALPLSGRNLDKVNGSPL